jgi:hypothetical protein
VAQLTVSDGTNNVAASPITVVVGVAASGLVAAYGFEEGSGSTLSDSSGNGNGGTISGASWTPSGRFGKALSFSSGMVSINDSASLHLSSGLTLEAWVRPSALTATWSDIIFKANDNYFLMGSTPQSQLPDLGGTFAATNLYGTNALALNTWTHIAGTYDGTTMRFYVNGVAVASAAQTGAIPSSTGNLFIGGDSSNGQHWNGLIDEVRVYNRALSAGEIAHDMTTPVIGASTGKPPVPQNLHVVTNP